MDIHPHEHATFRHDLPPLYVALRVTLIGVAQSTMYYVRQVAAPTAILSGQTKTNQFDRSDRLRTANVLPPSDLRSGRSDTP